MSEINKCLICGTLKPPSNHFFRVHKVPLAEYCENYVLKKDLLTGEPIKWKGRLDTYLNADFTSDENMKHWLVSRDLTSARKWCLDVIKKRHEVKKLTYIPCEVELRSLALPPVSFLDKVFAQDGGYYVLGESLGMKRRFKFMDAEFLKPTDDSLTIVVDTRETCPVLPSHIGVITAKLDYGDYTVAGSHLVVERKSLSDLVGTMSSGYERFLREIARSAGDAAHVVVMVETTLKHIMSFRDTPIMKKVKVTPEFIMHRVRACLQSFSNLQFFFCNNRQDLGATMLKILGNTELASKIDLQSLRSSHKI